MRVSVIQMNPGHDKAANIAQARRLIEGAVASDRPDMVVLPEVWSCLGGDSAAKFGQAEELPAAGSGAPGGAAYEAMRGLAREKGIFVHGGSILERAGLERAGGEQAGGKLYNTTIAFDPEGRELARYRKIHLFDIVTPDGMGYRESATFGYGEQIVTYQAGELKIGCAICYDIRFPELFLALRRQEVDVICLPAAFTLQTGKDHWETLIRSRAIETQCWFAATGTWGRHIDADGGARFTYGHSLICDPWGHVVAKVSDGEGWASARIDTALSERVRRDMPVLEHRRLV